MEAHDALVVFGAAGGFAEDSDPVDGVFRKGFLHLLSALPQGQHALLGLGVLAFAGFELLHPRAGVHDELGIVETALDEVQSAAVLFVVSGQLFRRGIEVRLRLGKQGRSVVARQMECAMAAGFRSHELHARALHELPVGLHLGGGRTEATLVVVVHQRGDIGLRIPREMSERVVMRSLRGPVQPEEIKVEAQAVLLRGEAEVLGGLGDRHVRQAPAQAGRAAEIGAPHEVLGDFGPAGVLLHRQLPFLGRAQVEIGHAGDDDVVVRDDADRRVARKPVGVEQHEQLTIREALLQQARERVGKTHVAIRLRHALELHAATEAPFHLFPLRMIPGEAVRAGAVTAGVTIVG